MYPELRCTDDSGRGVSLHKAVVDSFIGKAAQVSECNVVRDNNVIQVRGLSNGLLYFGGDEGHMDHATFHDPDLT